MSNDVRSGVLLLRVWTEGPAPVALRVRITHLLDVTESRQVVVTASSVDEVCIVVREWLEGIVAGGDG
jgi:hypothetical protein